MTIASDAVLDGSLDVVATCVRVSACSAEPASLAGIAAVSLGSYTITAGDGNGDWVIANGDTSGRKITLGAQSGNNGTATGDADYLAYDDTATMHYTTAASGQTINSGSPWTVGSYDVAEIRDPVNE